MSRSPDLYDDFEHRGEWWLPDDDSVRFPGILTVKKGEPSMVLMGAFSKTMELLSAKSAFSPSIIHGQLTDGTEVTLVRSIPLRQSLGFGPPHAEYLAESAMVGAHCIDETPFANVSLCFTGLDGWAGASPFELKRRLEPASSSPRLRQAVASFDPPPDTIITIPDRACEVALTFSFADASTLSTVLWSHENHLQLTPSTPQPLSWYLSVREELRNMFAILIGEPVFTRRFQARTEDRDIDVYHTQRGSSSPSRLSGSVLIPLSLLRTLDLGERLRRWFAVMNRFKPTIDLYLGTVYPPSTFVEFEFIALTQALESFHRRKYPDHYVSEEDYEKIKAPMLNAVPPGTIGPLRQKLSAILKYGNELSLRKRLDQLLADISDLAFGLVSHRKRSVFLETIVDARNFWTHHPVDAPGAPLKGRDLSIVNMRLKVLVHLLLLKEVGFDEALVVERIRSHSHLRHLAEPIPPPEGEVAKAIP